MAFMKLLRNRKQYKGYGHKKGDILLMDDVVVEDVYRLDTDGNKYFDEDVAELTPEEQEKCLKVENIPL